MSCSCTCVLAALQQLVPVLHRPIAAILFKVQSFQGALGSLISSWADLPDFKLGRSYQPVHSNPVAVNVDAGRAEQVGQQRPMTQYCTSCWPWSRAMCLTRILPYAQSIRLSPA
jgi:hypothetical protein